MNPTETSSVKATLDSVMHKQPIWKVGARVWVKNDVKTVHQGTSAEKDALDVVLKANLSLDWTGSRKILSIGCSTKRHSTRISPHKGETSVSLFPYV